MTVDITFSANGGPNVKKTYDLLVIGCDPTALNTVMDYSTSEQKIFSKFKRYAIHTTLATIKRTEPATYGVVFSPTANEAMQGEIYAYRNETAKQFGLDIANTLDENLYTIYQLGGEADTNGQPWTAQAFKKIFHSTIGKLDWWPNGGATIHKKVFTPYFDHFDASDVAAGLPWDYLALQGTAKTLYVHASTCFESALHCWAYIRDLMTKEPQGIAALPTDKANAKIAIVGAGVSGVLAANRLVRLGYQPGNIDMLEKTDRFGGKTHTQYVTGPAAKGGDPMTVCEMGTCYLSPSYAPMVADMQRYIGGNVQIDFAAREANFRGIVIPKAERTGSDPVEAYNTYVVTEAARLAGMPLDYDFEKDAFYVYLADRLWAYIEAHKRYIGPELPMPMTPPAAFLQDYGDKSFGAYLDALDLTVLRPMMEYMYEVQGYGSLDKIPAFYGLLWVTPPVIKGVLISTVQKDIWGILPDWLLTKFEQEFGLEPVKVVTAWTQGWEQLWTQIIAIDGLEGQISYCTDISAITRS